MARTQTPSQEAIRLRSYEIWEREGCPHGAALDHWLRAEDELKTKTRARPGRRKAAPKTEKKNKK